MASIDFDGTVRTVVARHLRLAPEALTRDAYLETDLGIDDVNATSVMVAVEQALDVRFPDDFLDGIRTFGELTSAVRIAVGA